jgi:hypothetical protein
MQSKTIADATPGKGKKAASPAAPKVSVRVLTLVEACTTCLYVILPVQPKQKPATTDPNESTSASWSVKSKPTRGDLEKVPAKHVSAHL